MVTSRIIKLKKISLLLILLVLSLVFSIFIADDTGTFLSGRALVHELGKEVDATQHKKVSENRHDESADIIHERLLRMNTNDYGRYNPAPKLSKPRFKIIPN